MEVTTKYPDFIIIGAMKCGTTSLYHYLSHHPDIFMPKEKELDYFVEEINFSKGEEWYASQFTQQYKLNGEASPNYTKAHLFKGVPQKIHQLLPDVKLIYLFRDPVERVYSHYIHNYSIGRETRPLTKALTADSNYLKTSKYFFQVQEYLKYFDRSQLLIINAEELRTNKEKVLQKVCAFLGVEFDFEEGILSQDLHKSKTKTKRSAFNTWVLNTSVGKFLKNTIPEGWKLYYREKTEKPLKKPVMSTELERKIEKNLREDYSNFKKFITDQSTVSE
ncbi:sulfotransferase domain-containing protein [Gracilimonas sp.]|uniref:sulfotransferase domain-containing protein n=1 Tax=Gracilimonas sp. TaxID=1974203 RepID=UPI0028718E3B|nr:sulfotransferase domain-containing protein [Gracilimonas sp.]